MPDLFMRGVWGGAATGAGKGSGAGAGGSKAISSTFERRFGRNDATGEYCHGSLSGVFGFIVVMGVSIGPFMSKNESSGSLTVVAFIRDARCSGIVQNSCRLGAKAASPAFTFYLDFLLLSSSPVPVVQRIEQGFPKP